MRGIFFTADDLGISREANEAMLHAHTHGALHGAALMLGQPGTDHAVELARATPQLDVGFHLHLCDSRPLTLGGSGWPWGTDPARAGWAIGTQRSARALAEAEIARQWQEFRATGLRCAFINAHHHLHVHPFVMARLREIIGGSDSAGAGDAWWRWGRPRWFEKSPGFGAVSRMLASAGWGAVRTMSRLPKSAASPLTLWGIDRSFCMDAGEVTAAIKTIDTETEPAMAAGAPRHELLFHPRRISYDDKDLQALLQLRQSA